MESGDADELTKGGMASSYGTSEGVVEKSGLGAGGGEGERNISTDGR